MKKLRSLIMPDARRVAAQAEYIALVKASRNPFFYTDCGVPDTLDGRFDCVLLHLFLQVREEADSEHERLLIEGLIEDMDRTLREMGVGDMGVSKRVRKMSEAMYGRLQAYRKAWGDDALFAEALKRNLYRGNAVDEQAMLKLKAHLSQHQTGLRLA